MTSTAVLALLIGLVIGAVCMWFIGRAQGQSTTSTHQASLAEARALTERARAETSQARVELAQQRELSAQARTETALAQAERAEARSEVADAQARASEARSQLAGALAERDAALAQVKSIEADRQRMVDQFKVLSAEQLEQQGRQADAAAAERQKQVDAIVAPLTQQLKEFQTRLHEMEKERVSISTELREQVRQVTLTGDQVRRETAALATALRKPQVRGQWGELQLKRVVEMAGMVEHCHFVQQGTTTTTSETTIRPDMTVLLGEDKYVHVDSKVPLSAFLDAQEASNETDRERLMGQFMRNVRSHVDQLSSKQYWKSEVGTPEFVVMFIPAEALAAEALNRMPDLLQYASERGIILATPTSLIGLLKTVAHSWRQAQLADSAREVFELARELYQRLSTMGEHVGKLGRALGSAVKAYNQTVGSLEGRVLPTARKLQALNVVDAELSTPAVVDEPLRDITAAELLEPADELPALTQRQDPSVDELVEQTTPSPQPRSLRKLG